MNRYTEIANEAALSPADEPHPLTRPLLYGQAGYYLLTGVWSLVDIGSFQRVTGPKVDTWLVKMVGALVVVIGAALGLAGLKRRVVPETALLAVGSAGAFTAIDVFYVARKRISPIYLLDAVAEVALIGAWAVALREAGTRRANNK